MVNCLRESLLNAIERNGDSLISEVVKAIQTSLECDMCTLWSINHNNTDNDIGEFDSASLLERCLKEGFYLDHHNKDYVHPLSNSFIKYVIDNTTHSNITHYLCSLNDAECKKHMSYDTLRVMGFRHFVSIPIRDNLKKKEVVAFIKLAYKDSIPFSTDNLNTIADVINQVVMSALSRYQIYQQQQVLIDLIKNYSRNKSTLKDVFYPIIHNIFKKYFDYEGASVFIWDSFDNRYNLLSTTGLEPYNGIAFYENGEGLTGMAASEKKAKIYDDLKYLEETGDIRYLHKYREHTDNHGKTMLAVPILRPSNPEEVLGIIRFTNKLNRQSKKEGGAVLDYFNDTDVDLINNASHYLALNIENYLADEERKDFISKMSHEFKTPASAIKITADRALRKSNDAQFMQSHFKHYMESIIDYSNLQIMQVTTNLFLTKTNTGKKSRYVIGNYAIRDIIQESIDIIRPIARLHGTQFANIHIDPDFPNITLKVDKNALKMVFYNLLSNSIKYVCQDKDFCVMFRGLDTPKGLRIYVSDEGIGIDATDKDKIFLLGVRSKNARIINAEGYGIGLHVVKLILSQFDGKIRVSNNRNPTTFEIELPRKLYT